MGNSLSNESSLTSQLRFTTVKFICPECHEIPDVMDEQDNTILLRPCGHEFWRTDLTAVIEHLQTLDDLIQHHDAVTTPLERQSIREDILAMGAKFDADLERCGIRSESISEG